MLDQYYVRPTTVDRIRGSWIASAIEAYASWLTAQRYQQRSILQRIPIVVAFGEFARTNGAAEIADLPDHVESFVLAWVADRSGRNNKAHTRRKMAHCTRNPIRQMLRLAIAGYVGVVATCPTTPSNVRRRDFLSTSRKRRVFAQPRYVSTSSISGSLPLILSGSALVVSRV